MKVIFLDIDGVLNTDGYRRRLGTDYFSALIDPAMLPGLQRIVAETGAVIVLSSSWRKYYRPNGPQQDPAGICIAAAMEAAGLRIFDKTPLLGYGPRGDAIAAWLRGKSVESYVILDDNPIGRDRHLLAHFVQTDPGAGLCPAAVERAIAVLGGCLQPLPGLGKQIKTWVLSLRWR